MQHNPRTVIFICVIDIFNTVDNFIRLVHFQTYLTNSNIMCSLLNNTFNQIHINITFLISKNERIILNFFSKFPKILVASVTSLLLLLNGHIRSLSVTYFRQEMDTKIIYTEIYA
jgi:hypothetical protein